MEPARKSMAAQNKSLMANELNSFFLRFEVDTVKKCSDVINSLPCNDADTWIIIDPGVVTRVFKTLQTSKATGPDGMGGLPPHGTVCSSCQSTHTYSA